MYALEQQSWLSPDRIGLAVLAILSILASPVVVVYELLLGLVLVAAGGIARRVRPHAASGPKIGAIGLVLLAGPAAYTVAWLLGGFFDW